MTKEQNKSLDFLSSDFETQIMESLFGLATKCETTDTEPYAKTAAAILTPSGELLTSYRNKAGDGEHAEIYVMNLANETSNLKDCIVYTMLEPCTYRKDTSKADCTTQLIRARIKKVVVGLLDPNLRIHGQSVERLVKNGIRVEILQDRMRTSLRLKEILREVWALNLNYFRKRTYWKYLADPNWNQSNSYCHSEFTLLPPSITNEFYILLQCLGGEDKSFLDLATGVGGAIVEAKLFKYYRECTGIDPKVVNVGAARRQLSEISNVSFWSMDGTQPLLFSPHSFDVVSVTFGKYSPDVVGENLKNGGYFVFLGNQDMQKEEQLKENGLEIVRKDTFQSPQTGNIELLLAKT